jgi:pimeloyl-ACP methyl ester carboxylesterase
MDELMSPALDTRDATVEPLFVTHAGVHLAAAITLPSRPVALAVLLQGFGAPRSHRNRLWTFTAADLAAHGIASVRFDYPGMGDSTGQAGWELDAPPTDAARAVIEKALEMVGVERFAVAGNCMGARMAVAIGATDPGCNSVGVILPGTLDGIIDVDQPGTALSRIAPILRGAPRLQRVANGLGRRRSEHRLRLIRDIPALLGSKPMLLLMLGSDEMWRRIHGAVQSVASRVGSPAPEHVIGVHVRTEGRFGLQPLSSQAAVRRILVDWFDRALQPPGAPPVIDLTAHGYQQVG